ncbi:MAG: arsenite methyltransferase [Saprospiraceae bacterium]|jgi:arsenite methyltransferase
MVKYDAAMAKSIEKSYATPDIAQQRLTTIQSLSLRAGEQVLDVGCGTGFLTAEMASLVGEQGLVHGLDYSADMLATAHQRCDDTSQIKLTKASAEALPFPDNTFDAATCTQVLLYVEDADKALRELNRTLKPGGRVAIIETDWRGLVLNSFDDALTRRIINAFPQEVPNPNLPPSMPKRLSSAGFSNIKCSTIPIINLHNGPAYFAHTALEWHGKIALKHNIISQDELTAWLDDLDARARNDDFFMCFDRYLFNATKA